MDAGEQIPRLEELESQNNMDEYIKTLGFATRCAHAGRVKEDGTGAVTAPIYPSSTYRVDYPGDESGYVYSRAHNPTRRTLEESLATLENAEFAYAYASGLAALNALFSALKTGDHVVTANDLYGGTHRQFERILGPNFGIQFTFVDPSDPSAFEASIKENTKMFWLETPSNPLLKVTDIEKVTAIAKKHNIITGVDNTFATPYIQQPLSLGADIVLHSMSKYLGGHCDVIAGALMTNDSGLAEKIKFNQYAIGGMLGPFESWLVLRGLKTLPIRMEKHAANAKLVAQFLVKQPAVETVLFPGLDGSPLPNKMTLPGGMVSFSLKADFEKVKEFCTALKLFILAESLGSVESLVNHPASMTHASIPKEIREQNGVTDSLVRLSVGIEEAEDLIADLKQALSAL